MNDKWFDENCPPHRFEAAWSDEHAGAMYCRYCGEVRALTPPTIAAPVEESITAEDK